MAGVRREPDWLLLVPLLLELYVFVVALALIAATLFVRFRDVGQIWEVASSLLFFVRADHVPDRDPPGLGAAR